MRRLAKPLLVLAALLVAVFALRQVLASDQTRIRWRIESMMEGFNDTRLAPAMQGIGADWRDRTRRVDRARLADGLRYLFFNEKDPETRGFPYRVELERDTLEIELQPQNRAQVRFVARFSFLTQGRWEPTWRLRVSTTMHKHENLGWQLQESEHETLESDGRLYR